jgi:hypothetical protein
MTKRTQLFEFLIRQSFGRLLFNSECFNVLIMEIKIIKLKVGDDCHKFIIEMFLIKKSKTKGSVFLIHLKFFFNFPEKTFPCPLAQSAVANY